MVGPETLFFLGLVAAGVVTAGWRAWFGPRGNTRQHCWQGPDALRAALEIEAGGADRRRREDLLICSDSGRPDAERAQALRRLSASLPKEHLGPLLGFMGSRCGALTCAEIFRLARFHPSPGALEGAAMAVIEETGSDTLRLMAVEALGEVGSAVVRPLLKRIAGDHHTGEVRTAASTALARVEARLARPPQLEGALSVLEEAGAVSEPAASTRSTP